MNCTLAHMLTVFLAAMLTGCSFESKVPCFPVRGQVFLNEKPAKGMLVVFNPKGAKPAIPMLPNGHVEADGSFAISTYGNNDGAPLGEYRITLLVPATDHEEHPEITPQVRNRYARPDYPIATFEVRQGENEVPAIKLK